AFPPQTRDMFADLGLGFPQWFFFFVSLFAWAWVVHASARRSLEHDYWVPDAHVSGGLTDQRRSQLRKEYRLPALFVPRILGLQVFVFVVIALLHARGELVNAASALPEAASAVSLATLLSLITVLLAGLYTIGIEKGRILSGWHRAG